MIGCELYALAWQRLGLRPRDLIAMDTETLRHTIDYLLTTPHEGPRTMPREPLPLRRYEVAYFTDPDNPGSSPVFVKKINAAYWADEPFTGDEPIRFITFKDTDHKPVYTIRRAMIASIEEIRDKDKP